MTKHADLAAWRSEFPIYDHTLYFNTCSLGPLSRRGRAAVNRFLDLWESMGASAWYTLWLGEITALRARFARLINAQPHEVAIVPSVSAALAAIASALDYTARPRIIANALDFPTIGHQWLAREREGAQIEFLPSPDRVHIPLDAFEHAVDDRTALVATSEVIYSSGFWQDVSAIAAIAHRHGALCLIDGYQSAGQVPVDVKASGVDIFISGGLKWLLGGPGIAYLYVREELHHLAPTTTGWFADANQFSFDVEHFNPRPDATRFEAGTPAVAAVFAANAGLEIVLEIGPPRLRERQVGLTRDLIDRALATGLTVRSPLDDDRRAGIVMIETPDPPAVVRGLRERGIIVDYRPGRVRLSPYFYNTEDDNRAVIDAIQAIVAG